MMTTETKLFKQIEKSHGQWMTDACDRYEKAKLWPPECAAAMTVVLLEALASVWAAGHNTEPDDDDKLCGVLKRMIKARTELAQRIRREEQINGH